MVKAAFDGDGLKDDGEVGGCEEEGADGAGLSNIAKDLRIFLGGEGGVDASVLTKEVFVGLEDDEEVVGKDSSTSIVLFFLSDVPPVPPIRSSSSLPSLAAISSSVSSLTSIPSSPSSEMRSITSSAFDFAFPFALVSFDGAGGGGRKKEVRLD